MTWTAGGLRPFQIRTSPVGRASVNPEQVVFEDAWILAPYGRTVCRLLAEERHGELGGRHEAIHRQSYARRVLDKFAQEYKSFRGPIASFRSGVLSPILARQRRGFPSTYGWPVGEAVSGGRDRLTLRDATRFYLGEDSTDPGLIPSCRASIIRIQHARWHLATAMEVVNLGDARAYDQVDINQTHLMDYPWREPLGLHGPYPKEGELPPDDWPVGKEATEEGELP